MHLILDFDSTIVGCETHEVFVRAKAQQKIDLFNDTQFDIKTIFNAENRIGGVVQYATPGMNGFKATVALIPGEETGTEDGLADGVSASFNYKSGDFWHLAFNS